MEEERERAKAAQDEAEVEAHRAKAMDDSEAPAEPGRRASDDDDDVEAHRAKA